MSGPASPAPSDSDARRGEVSYRFCQECSNLLYPREDRSLNKLLYVCKACSSVQEHDSACTYRTHLSSSIQETAGVTQNVASDPTVGSLSDSPSFCTMCGECLKCVECGEPAADDSDGSETDAPPLATPL